VERFGLLKIIARAMTIPVVGEADAGMVVRRRSEGRWKRSTPPVLRAFGTARRMGLGSFGWTKVREENGTSSADAVLSSGGAVEESSTFSASP
jgi:hypothetical protein